MRKDRLTPRKEGKKTNRSISPHNAASKSKLKSCFAAQKHAGKENESVNSHQQESIKICLDLANYHKNESEELKQRNGLLEGKFTEQMRDMEDLRSELKIIKVAIQGNQGDKKVVEGLKTENASLKR